MNEPNDNISSADDEAFVEALAAYDEGLRCGQSRSPKGGTIGSGCADNSTDEAMRVCLEVLESVYPRQRGAQSPERIARFEIERLLGQGGFGLVYLAHDPALSRRVALKVPRPHVLERPELRERFLREARAAGRLDHPHIVPVYEVGVEGGMCFISSAYCDGGTLDDWLKRRTAPVPAELAARLVMQLAEAVQHAHDRDVLHRDLKPANVLLVNARSPGFSRNELPTSVRAHGTHNAPPEGGTTSAVPTLKIADFGLAKLLDGDDTRTQSGALFGTPAYMSPEQAAGGSIRVDGRSDIYSLGVILYELLAGRRPFEGEPQTVMRRLLTETPPAPRQIRREIPRDLETVCLKAMARDREQRYATAGDLADDVRRWLAREPIAARRPRVPLGKQLFTRRNFTGLALSSLPVIGYAMWAGDRRAEGSERTVRLTTDPAGADVWFIPLNELTREPQPEKIVTAGKSPVAIDLPPGDYLVEAVLDERRFHEVYRHVPGADEGMPEIFRHHFWGSRSGDAIDLIAISIPSANVIDGMAKLAGNPRLALGVPSQQGITPHFCSVPSFYMDAYECTYGEYLSGNFIARGAMQQPANSTARHAVPVTFDQALMVAEHFGKRVPDECEYELAATANGTRRFPEQDDDSREFGPVGSPAFDRVNLDRRVPIFGLCSNVAEWTTNVPVNYPRAGVEMARLRDHEAFRIVRGGSPGVINGDARVSASMRDPKGRTCVPSGKTLPGLGVRLVRSLQPRLAKADFPRVLPDANHPGTTGHQTPLATE